MLEIVSAWLLTYWIHSTIALGIMWLVSSRLRERHLAVEEAGWRAALFLTLLTATLQLGLTHLVDWRPLAGSVKVPSVTAQVTGQGTFGESATGSSNGSASDPRATSDPLNERSRAGSGSTRETSGAFGGVESDADEAPALGVDPVRLLLGLWLLVTAALLLRLVISCGLLARTLKRRTLVSEGRHADLLARLCARALVTRSVALSVCRALLVPLALGLRRWEVCLPSKVADEFEPEEQETVLAHELAHLIRRDTIWQLASRAVTSVLFLQPLNFVAVSRLQTLAELRCDDWAVERTGRPVTLAKCLTRVASWRSESWGRLPVPAMASANRSRFGRRVRRLLSRSYPQPQSGVPRWLNLAVVPLVLSFVAAAPGVVRHPDAPAAPVAPVAPVGSVRPAVAAAPVLEPAPPVAVVLESPPVPMAKGPSAAAVPGPIPVVAPAPGAPPATAPAPEIVASPSPRPPSLAKTDPVLAPVRQPDSEPAPMPAVAPAPSRALTAPPAEVVPPIAPTLASTPMAISPEVSPAPARAPQATAVTARLAAAPLAPSAPTPEAEDDCDSESGWVSDSGKDSDSESDDWQSYDEEMDEFEEALEDELDALEDRIESEFEVLEDELDRELEMAEDASDEELELLVEEYEDQLEDGVEDLQDDLEELEERLEEGNGTHGSRAHRRQAAREIERWEAELERFEDQHEGDLERIVEAFERDLERLWERDVESRFEQALARQEAMSERRLEGAERQMEAAARRYEAARTPENRERLLAEVREQARLALPTEAELAEMRAEVLKIRTELAPRLEAARAAHEELRHALEEWRARYAAELERLRQSQRELVGRSD